MKRFLIIFSLIVLSILLILGFESKLGHVEIEWLGYRLETNVALAALLILVIFLLVVFFYKLVRSIFGFPFWVREHSALRQQKKTAQQLQQGLISFIMRDGETLALEAEGLKRNSGEKGLALFFRAEASLLKGERKVAHDRYLELSRVKGFEVLGLNGLLKLALDQGGYEEVLYYVMACEKYYVSSPWLMDILFEAALRFYKFEDALDALRRKKALKAFRPEEYQKKVAMVLLVQALKEKDQGNQENYERFVEQSYESDESYLPALLHFLPVLLREGKHSRLRKIIERSWSSSPHPDLARLYAESMPGSTDVEVFRLIQRLSSFAPHHPESRLEMARYALKAKLWGQSREYLESLINENSKISEVYYLRAQLEEAETGDASRAFPWLEKMMNLNFKGHWFCSSCLSCTPNWQMICPNCHALGELEWTSV